MSEMKQKIMSAARATVQDRGYGGLSFRELAKDVGIKSASIHHYFPSKGDLGAAVAEQYTSEFKRYLDGLIAESLDPAECVRRYIGVFRATLVNENRMCLGGIMAAEHKELPSEVQAAVVAFSEMNMRWLIEVLTLRKRPRKGKVTIESQALALYAAIEGAQLVARGFEDVGVYDRAMDAYEALGLFS